VKRSLLALTALALCFSARADENITKAQTRLQAEGFYRGNLTGTYDSETAAAVTRYQIRHGLAITGKLDAATSRELGIFASEAPSKVLSGSWRRLRSGEMEFVQQPSAEGSPKPKDLARTNSAVSSSASSPARSAPPRAEPALGAQNPPSSSSASISAEDGLSEAMRNYVAAFILAGLDPHIGSELEFFAPQVDYFGVRNVARAKIERDLIRYDRQWPERRFWLDGGISVRRRTTTAIEFDFPLRYELQNGSKHASGKVIKSLSLVAGGDNEMQIVAVNERKAQ
jgi:peptidoglycan hydrolase-like protein with peptidoglycan-binding domain